MQNKLVNFVIKGAGYIFELLSEVLQNIIVSGPFYYLQLNATSFSS